MKGTKVLFAVSLFAGAATAGAAGCGSSKSGGDTSPTPGADSGSTGDDGGSTGPTSGSSGSRCSPLSGNTCNPGQGLTCCVDLLAIISDPAGIGTCVAESACKSNVQYACSNPTQCMSGQACCGGFSIEGGLLSGLLDAGDASFDAAAFFGDADNESDGGIGLNAALMDITLQSFCQSSCTAGQLVLCGTDSDCPSNMVCSSPVGTFSSGQAGGLGAVLGAVSLVSGGSDSGIGNLMTCAPPVVDAGTPPSDAGGLSAEAGTTPTDAGTTGIDSGAPIEAGVLSDAASAEASTDGGATD